MSLTITNEQELTLQVSPRTAAGNLGTIDGAPKWSLSDPSKGKLLAVDGEPDKVVFWPVDGAGGTVQVIATCDADLGQGVREISGIFDLEILSPEATVAEVTAVGEPTTKRAEETPAS